MPLEIYLAEMKDLLNMSRVGTSTWFCGILLGMLHGPRLLYLLRLFINFSMSDSWTELGGEMSLKYSSLNMF